MQTVWEVARVRLPQHHGPQQDAARPPLGVPLLPLAPAAWAVYAASAWYPRSLLLGAAMLAFGWFGLFNLSRSW